MEQGGVRHGGADRTGGQRDGAVHGATSEPEATLAERMGIKILELSAERVVGTMPVAGNTGSTLAGGALHSGAAGLLAETLGSSGAAVHGGPDRSAVTIEVNATHHRPADTEVTGVATRVHGGSTLATYDVEITDASGRRVCTARLTCRLHDRRAEDPGDGEGT